MNDAGPSPPLVEIQGLVKRFHDKTVLDGVDLTIERGETVVIIGESGSGKTTLARLLMGLDRPTKGSIFVDGVEMTSLGDRDATALRRRFAMVFQRAALLDSMTVFDNVAFPLREETDLDEAEIRARVIRQLEELGIGRAIDKMPAELSGGMAKRVGIARAMVTEPEIIVYDEPTSGLDPVTSRVVDALIEQLREKFGVTSVVITHDMVTAMNIADRVVLLAGGKIVADGPPQEVFHSHREALRPFALSSGIDLERIAPRGERRTAAEIRGARDRVRADDAGAPRRWFAGRAGRG